MAGDSPLDVADRVAETMAAVSKALRAETKAAMGAAAKVARAEMARTAVQVPGSDRRFSHWRGRPLLSTSTKVEDGLSGGGVALRVSPRGPWGVAEKGAAPHGGHPGTRSTQGRQSWSRGRDATFDVLGVELPERFERVVEEAFEGAG